MALQFINYLCFFDDSLGSDISSNEVDHIPLHTLENCSNMVFVGAFSKFFNDSTDKPRIKKPRKKQ